MFKAQNFYSALFGFHMALVTYYLATSSVDYTLHSFIFISGTIAVLLFAINKETFENKIAFLTTAIMLITTFYSSLFLGDSAGQVYRWLVLVMYNLAQSRTMTLVDIQKVAKRNIVFNSLMLVLNLIYMNI